MTKLVLAYTNQPAFGDFTEEEWQSVAEYIVGEGWEGELVLCDDDDIQSALDFFISDEDDEENKDAISLWERLRGVMKKHKLDVIGINL